MDLFAVDTWASDKATDDLNSQLFGEVHLPYPTTTSAKKLKSEKSQTAKSERKNISIESENDVQSKKTDKKKRKSQEISRDVAQSQQLSRNTKRKKTDLREISETSSPKKKKRSKSSAQAEVVETNCEAKSSPGFQGFLDDDLKKEATGPTKKKRKPSSKKNKYKHLDEIRKTQNEDEKNSGDKVENDIKAKLTKQTVKVHDNKGTNQNKNHTLEVQREKKRKASETKEKTLDSKEKCCVAASEVKIKKNKKKRQIEDLEEFSSQPLVEKPKKSKTLKDIGNKNNQHVVNGEAKVKRVKEKKRKSDGDAFDIPSKKNRAIEAEPEAIGQKKGNQKTKKLHFDTNQLKEALVREATTAPSTNAAQKETKSSRKAKEKTLSLRDRMMEQLNSARFRYLNEQLYTIPGHEALKLMQEDEAAFEVYHQGFQQQVEKWPENPVDRMIAYIKKRPGHVVADFGCGEAKIAQSVRNKIHSFDLVAPNEYVTACDMASVPLADRSVDIAVFCLSLMGTNVEDFIAEAHRVMKKGGNLIIAEVISRFDNTKKFIRKVERMGFTLLTEDSENKMFVWFELKKTAVIKGTLPTLQLAPCVYKKR